MKKVKFRTKTGKLVSFTPGKKSKKSYSYKKPKKRVRGKVNMARKRKTRVRYVTRKVKRYKRSGGQMSLQKLAMPIIVASIAEPFVDNLAARLPIPTIGGIQPDDVVKVAAAWYFKKKGGLMGNTIKMMGIFGLRNIVSQFMSGGLSSLTSQQQDVWT